MTRIACVVAPLAVVASMFASNADAHPGGHGPQPCGRTTLDATIADTNGDGVLECGPGEKLVARHGLVDGGSRLNANGTPLISFLFFADPQIADEELTLPSRTDWRAHPMLLPHMLDAQLRGANEIAKQGGPVFGKRHEAAFILGDLSDNAQFNEMRLMMDIFDGSQLVDPDSGRDGYDGTRKDPTGTGTLNSPVAGERIVDLANEPFWASGLRNADGSEIPWYAVHGNHDTKVMGSIPHDDATWRRAANAWATGGIKIFALSEPLKDEVARIRKDAPRSEPAFWLRVFKLAKTDPEAVGDVRKVAPDPDRRILSKQDWMTELSNTTGTPKGHGFGSEARVCPDVYPNEHARRACYAVDHGKFRFIALDDTQLEGFTNGSIDPAQFRWLEEELVSASSTYFDSDGQLVDNADATDRYVIVMSHHTSKSMTNTGNVETTTDELMGADLNALLLRFPNAIMHANGHSHSNRLWAHADPDKQTQYWELNLGSIADHPHTGRSIEIADNGDGTLSIYGVLFESGVHPNPRNIDWEADDPTDERALAGADRSINEDWLAAAGIEQAWAARAGHRYGAPSERNVELLLPDPFVMSVPQARSTSSSVRELAGVALASIVVIWILRRRRPRTPPQAPVAAARRRSVPTEAPRRKPIRSTTGV